MSSPARPVGFLAPLTLHVRRAAGMLAVAHLRMSPLNVSSNRGDDEGRRVVAWVQALELAGAAAAPVLDHRLCLLWYGAGLPWLGTKPLSKSRRGG